MLTHHPQSQSMSSYSLSQATCKKSAFVLKLLNFGVAVVLHDMFNGIKWDITKVNYKL